MGSGIWLVNADGTNARRVLGLTQPRFPNCGRLTWSPDGSRIAYETVDNTLTGEIYVVNADGSGETNVSENPDRLDADPNWLSDGRIVFLSQRDSTFGIYGVNADGSGLQRLARLSQQWGCPAVSPDGRRVAFMLLSGPASGDLYIADLTGANQRQVTRDSMIEFCPSWRP